MEVGILTNDGGTVMTWTVGHLLNMSQKVEPKKATGLRKMSELRLLYNEEEAQRIRAEERRNRCKMLMRELRRLK